MLHTFTRRALAIVFAFTLVCPVLADELDDKYLQILNTADQAESLEKAGKPDAAKAKYLAIQKALLEIKKADPTWKPNMVAHRLKDVESKLALLSPPSVTGETGNSAAGSSRPTSASSGDKATIKLIQAGAEPRQPLRLKPVAGTKQEFQVTVVGSFEMDAGPAGTQKVDQPTETLPVELLVKSVSSEGDIKFTCVIGEGTVGEASGLAAAVSDRIKSALKQAKGLSLDAEITSRGLSKGENNLPPGISPEVRTEVGKFLQIVSDFTDEFPEEPLGVGAKWELTRTRSQGGMTISLATSYELTALSGDRVELKYTQTQTAANQKVAIPNMPGMKTDLEKLAGTSQGTVTYDLTKVAPLAGKSLGSVDVRMSLSLAGQKQAMTMKTVTTAGLETK